MSELLPCPFCGGEAKLHDGLVIIPVIDENGAYIDADVEDTPAWVECAACGAATDGVDSADEAISAWNRRAQPENEPLTLEDLQKMDGEPAYIVPINLHKWICDARDGKPEWGMVRKSWVRIWRNETADLVHTDFDFSDYGKTWLAYRRKPERNEE